MWGEIVKRLPRFPSAVLTGLDASGDAVSVRCQPTVDHQAQVLRVLVPDGLGIVPGPAGLLCHRHDDQLWGLKSFLLRGSLEPADHDWVFHPHQLVRGLDTTPLSNLRLLRNSRRTAKRYLAARGLARPTIPWEHYAQLKHQVGVDSEQEAGRKAPQGDLPRQAPADREDLADDVQDRPGGQGQTADIDE